MGGHPYDPSIDRALARRAQPERPRVPRPFYWQGLSQFVAVQRAGRRAAKAPSAPGHQAPKDIERYAWYSRDNGESTRLTSAQRRRIKHKANRARKRAGL